jgi:hypothetical protein
MEEIGITKSLWDIIDPSRVPSVSYTHGWEAPRKQILVFHFYVVPAISVVS